jgi:hypothetical protein
MFRINLFGPRSKRTPLSYNPYRAISGSYFNYVEDPCDSDFLIFGISSDIFENINLINELLYKNPKLKLVVLSEEPLWDTLWSGDFFSRHSLINNQNLSFFNLNHFNSDIFKFNSFPYFVTTCDHFFIRYSNLFKRNSLLSTDKIQSIWRSSSFTQAYFAERRSGPDFDIKFPTKPDVFGLCSFRTDLALNAVGINVLRVGHGWENSNRRQSLPDWHLDKIARLDQESYIVSAIENTHQHDYITEKIFDSYAVLGVPLYVAGPEHMIHRIVPQDSFINLYGMTPYEAADKVQNFKPDSKFMAAYSEAQESLANLFSDSQCYWSERNNFISKIYSELSTINYLHN